MAIASEEPSSRPRVVHVVANLQEGGAETLVRGLCSRLPSQGIDVTIVSIYPSNLTADQERALGVPIVSIERQGRGDVGFYPRLVAALKRLKPDIVHSHLHAGKYAGRSAAILAGVPHIVFTEHGDELGGALRWSINRALHARTDTFVTFTAQQREELAAQERIDAAKIVVIPNGIALPQPPSADDRRRLRAEFALDDGDFAFIVPARLANQKNQGLALRALKLGIEAGYPWRLFLAGTGPNADAVAAEVAALGLSDRVRLLGFRPDVVSLYGGMDAFLMPSLWERMPLAIGEAMAAGLAIVTAPWNGYTAFVRDGDTGYVPADWSDAAFFSTMERAYRDPNRPAVAERAHDFAIATFDLTETTRTHADLYRSLVSRRGQTTGGRRAFSK